MMKCSVFLSSHSLGSNEGSESHSGGGTTAGTNLQFPTLYKHSTSQIQFMTICVGMNYVTLTLDT